MQRSRYARRIDASDDSTTLPPGLCAVWLHGGVTVEKRQTYHDHGSTTTKKYVHLGESMELEADLLACAETMLLLLRAVEATPVERLAPASAI